MKLGYYQKKHLSFLNKYNIFSDNQYKLIDIVETIASSLEENSFETLQSDYKS